MVRSVAVVVLSFACSYPASFRDCTITGSAASGCPSGFACGTEGLCRPAGVTGTCGTAVVDAGADATVEADASAADAPKMTGCPGDMDCDGVPDGSDNCPTIPNPDQHDEDNDHLGDSAIRARRSPTTPTLTATASVMPAIRTRRHRVTRSRCSKGLAAAFRAAGRLRARGRRSAIVSRRALAAASPACRQAGRALRTRRSRPASPLPCCTTRAAATRPPRASSSAVPSARSSMIWIRVAASKTWPSLPGQT